MANAAPTPNRGLLIAACIATAGAAEFFASYSYVSLPMQLEFKDSAEGAAFLRQLPYLAALLVIFPAGLLGARVRSDRMVMACGVLVTVGSLATALATALWMVTAGLLLANVGRCVLGIEIIGLLTIGFREERERGRAFAALAAVTPATYLAMPVIATASMHVAGWRAVPWLWAAGGVAIAVSARWLRVEHATDGAARRAPWPAIAASIALVLCVQAAHSLAFHGAVPATAAWAAGAIVVAAAALLARRAQRLHPIAATGSAGLGLLFLALVLSQCSNMWFYAAYLWQQVGRMTVFEVGLLLVPSQLGAIAGAWVAGRIDGERARTIGGTAMLAATAAMLFLSATQEQSTPTSVTLAILSGYSAAITAAGVFLTRAIMGAANAGEESRVSAARSAASSLGAALGVTLLTVAVTSATVTHVVDAAEQYGAAPTTVAALSDAIRDDVPTRSIVNDLDIHEPAASILRAARTEAIVRGYRTHGLVGGAAMAAAALLFLIAGRRRAPVTR
jgi:MFS family permease